MDFLQRLWLQLELWWMQGPRVASRLVTSDDQPIESYIRGVDTSALVKSIKSIGLDCCHSEQML